MLTHEQIWAGVDGLAARYGLTASGLARKSGLDPTTFNRSKRVAPDGRQRWPSTESISKVLNATGATVHEFLDLVTGSAGRPTRPLPLIAFAQVSTGGFFDEGGHPSGSGWDAVGFPNVLDEHAYAIEVSGDVMQPLYRDGDIVIVSPAAPVRLGDRVVVRTVEGEVLSTELKRKTAKTVELKALRPEHADRVLPADQIAWMARIVWTSQ